MKFNNFAFILILILTFSNCKQNDREQRSKDSKGSSKSNAVQDWEKTVKEYLKKYDNQPLVAKDLYEIDINQDIENKSLEELRILRNAMYAQQGYIFMKADIRGYFSATGWYDSLMYERWEREDMGAHVPIKFSKEEQKFIDRIKEREKELLKQNYVEINGQTHANIANIVNKFQFKQIDSKFLTIISKNGFVITPNNNIQLFHLYEQNDYAQIPNFVTTDLVLQLYHMYFSYLLRTMEEEVLWHRVSELTNALLKASLNDYKSNSDVQFKKSIGFSVVVFHVAARLLNDHAPDIPIELKKASDIEYQNIIDEKDRPSVFQGYHDVFFPYSLFKVRGHYTRTEKLKKYFKVMMWLQKAEMCMTSETFNHAIYMAQLLNTAKVNTKPALEVFESIYEPIKFVIGEPDNISIYDICVSPQMKGKNYSNVNREELKKELESLKKNRIKPQDQLSCADKINLFPQRYLFDNEILQDLVDTKSNVTKRPLPKGIDVFGVLGVKEARHLLEDFYQENKHWPDYDETFVKLEKKASNHVSESVYSEWITCLVNMQHEKPNVPYFMKLPEWRKKELNTALASWAELKHDAILYAEQPMGAECGDGGPPAPITVGYVEPNVTFWKELIALVDKTEKIFTTYDLSTKDIAAKTQQVKELGIFLLQVSEKEIKGTKLSDNEYQTIEIIGSSVEYMTISLLPHWVDDWSLVKGPDRNVAVVADIYTANARNNPDKGILHVATGPVNDIYVLVEIEGLLYLTKGATFSYYEFKEPMGSRLTDEEWQQRIENKKLPQIPSWMKSIIYDKKGPESNEKIFYSSGC